MLDAYNMVNAPWLTAMVEYEGQPLALRVRPAADTPSNRAKFPRLALVTHKLSNVTSKGLPEASYNESLAGFDRDVLAHVERGGGGLIALIETFSGKRNYYGYFAKDAGLLARFEELKVQYPQHALSIRAAADPNWTLYNDYRHRFKW